MGQLITADGYLPTMTGDAMAKVRALEDRVLQAPQVEIRIDHQLHAGVYSRTAFVPGGVVMTGAEITIDTQLIIVGDVTVYRGDSAVRLSGFNLLLADAGRKTAFLAHEDTAITMLFATNATSVEDAENEFTNEVHRLQSRQHIGE